MYLIFWTKQKTKYLMPLFFLGVILSIVNIWTYMSGDVSHFGSISSKIFLLIFSLVCWIQTKEKFWHRFMLLTAGWLVLGVYLGRKVGKNDFPRKIIELFSISV